ncbi:diaminopimelate epimerase [Haloarchaeobius salinus]|uniref:diaminopimelate epimerase n=1 Tax=Haloarchaeobius salinus TaxID=1198298 RepID=UPI00210A7F93|nr:diaminopimelate epimerase [Haloarchaeobius salinus]
MSISQRHVRYGKYNGTGNDFIVVDADEYVPDRGAFAAHHCDRTDGIAGDGERAGADGVLFLALEEKYSPPRVVMTLVQPDGSTAEMCGNGARVAAEWAMARTGASEVMIDTQAGTRHARRVDGPDGGPEVAIEMGEPSFAPEIVPLDRDEPLVEGQLGGYAVTGINTGVPHAVIFVDDVDAVDLAADAPPIRHHDVFPEGANVTFAAPRDDGGYDQRTFERGVEGETLSCGTGAVAIAAVAAHLGRCEDDVATVSPPGGDLRVEVPDDGPAVLYGPVAHEFDGEVPVTPPTAD